MDKADDIGRKLAHRYPAQTQAQTELRVHQSHNATHVCQLPCISWIYLPFLLLSVPPSICKLLPLAFLVFQLFHSYVYPVISMQAT